MATLATPQIVVNNETIGIKPNSFTYTEGFGERKVRVKSTGGGQKEIITTRDVETELSMCKFIIYAEDTPIETVRDWLANVDANVIQAADGNFQRTFTQAIITNNPEVNLGVDGEVEVEFQSAPAV